MAKKTAAWKRNVTPGYRTESDFANQRMGRNRLQANDQTSVYNQRQATPDNKDAPDDDVRESYEKLDKGFRAESALGKGRRKTGGSEYRPIDLNPSEVSLPRTSGPALCPHACESS